MDERLFQQPASGLGRLPIHTDVRSHQHGFESQVKGAGRLGTGSDCSNRTSDVAASPKTVAQLLAERFRCPQEILDFGIIGDTWSDPGYFRFGPDIICYGKCSSGRSATHVTDPLHDAREHVLTSGSSVELTFDPVQVVDNLLYERYLANPNGGKVPLPANSVARNLYYWMRPLMPVNVRRHLQKLYLHRRLKTPFPMWPVDRTVESICEQLLVLSMRSRKIERVPFIWFWPDGARTCTIITHDVETSRGLHFCQKLMDLNDSFGLKTSFQIVPEERYHVLPPLLENIRDRGFEINIHDLNHDGHLLRDRDEFVRRAEKINRYARQFGALGFRSAILYRNIDWYAALDLSYDMSVPSVAHMDPQPGGCCSVLPFFIGKLLELPVTATQDYTLFHILNDYSTRLWKEQIALIREKYGLISFIIHPDYVIADAARRVYAELLQYLSELRSQGETWIALPGEAAAWWRLRSEMNLVNVAGSWRIEGKGSERARLAYAEMVNDTLSYRIEPAR